MTTNARNTLTAAALGLASFTVTSALVSGLFATPTVVGFALLAVYGMGEIALLSYAAPRSRPTRLVKPARSVSVFRVRRVPALVEYPVFARRPVARSIAA